MSHPRSVEGWVSCGFELPGLVADAPAHSIGARWSLSSLPNPNNSFILRSTAHPWQFINFISRVAANSTWPNSFPSSLGLLTPGATGNGRSVTQREEVYGFIYWPSGCTLLWRVSCAPTQRHMHTHVHIKAAAPWSHNPLPEPLLISLIFDSYLAVSREEQSFVLCNSY